MTKKLLFVTTILLVVAFVAVAADVTGKWTYVYLGTVIADSQQHLDAGLMRILASLPIS